MQRRKFLKNISLSGLGPLLLNGLPVNALANTVGGLQSLAATSTNDRVLVLIQLHGGNDGLNTLVPLHQYDQYVNLRSNIALPRKGSRAIIPLDSTLSEQQRLGLHPDMHSFKNLYDQGKAALVQSVAYHNMNGSHFRSRDVWFMGGDYNSNYNSGWAGRYLDNIFPGYPDSYPSEGMPDPLAVEIGSRVSLTFHRSNGLPVAIALENPERYYQLVSSVGGKLPGKEDGYYGEEIDYIKGIEQQANDYSQRIEQVFAKGKNSGVTYPTQYPYQTSSTLRKNTLATPLKTIARLLNGGSKTKIFLARLNGFDTHAHQAVRQDPTHGDHAALLYNLFSAIEAFQTDLRNLGIEDRVMTATFSEFGRRVRSNDSLGTDHGTAAPMFVFGKHVKPGVVGKNPDLFNLDNRDNLKQQYDYRQVFGTLMADWLQAPPEAVQASKFSNFTTNEQKLPLVQGITAPSPSPSPAPAPAPAPAPSPSPTGSFEVYHCYPNPAWEHTVVRYKTDYTLPLVVLTLRDGNGESLMVEKRENIPPGKHDITLIVRHLSTGTYYYTMEAGGHKQTGRLQKV